MIRLFFLSFSGNGRQTYSQSVRQTPLTTFLWSPCRIPLQTEADLQQAQEESVHCQDPRGLIRSPAEPQREATVTPPRLSFCLIRSFALRLSPSPHLAPIPFLLVFKNTSGILMLPINDSHNSDTVTNRRECHPGSSRSPRRVTLIPGQLREYWFQLSTH